MPRSKWLVAALGNPLQGPDGFGPAVADRLRGARGLPDGVDLIDAHTDLLTHLDRFAQYDGVVLVDAVLGGASGQVAVVDEETFSRWDEHSPGSHSVSPLVAVKLFRQLYPTSRTRIALVALYVDKLRFGTGVSDSAVEAGALAVTRLVSQVGGAQR
jgi:hydrogenase maturation protease